jgi:lysophospholipase L1-like esterase
VRRGTLVKLAIAVVSSIVTIAALEAGAWLLLKTSWGERVVDELKHPDLNPTPLVSDRDLLWRNTASARKTQPINPRPFGHQDAWTIEINSEGFRGPERDHQNDEGADVYRILCIGDSITFGFNVDQDATFARRISDWLAKKYPGRRFEVINTGVPGWSWAQGLRFLELEGLALRPNLIIAAHGTNDRFWPAKVTDVERLQRAEDSGSPYLMPLAVLLTRTNTYRALMRLWPQKEDEAAESEGCKAQIARTGSCRRLSLDDVSAAVSEFARLAASNGSDLLVLDVDFNETGAAWGSRAAAKKAGIPFLDLVGQIGDLRRRDEEDRAARLGLMAAGEISSAADGRAARAQTHKLTLRVLAPPSAAEVSVKGTAFDAFENVMLRFDEKMYDDGKRADEVADDHVFSATVEFPRGVAKIEYKYFVAATAEFESLPPLPSSMGNRGRRIERDIVTPIEVFGEMFLMAERTHPNARGHEIIATTIADQIEQLPSFRAFIARAS